jgi:hypothetical protein
MRSSVIIRAAATLKASPENAPPSSTLSLFLTGRVLSQIDVMVASRKTVPCDQIASAETYYSCPLDVVPVRLDSLGQSLTLRVDATAVHAPMLVHVSLEFEIDDGDPSGPFVAALPVLDLQFDPKSSTVTRTLPRRVFERP